MIARIVTRSGNARQVHTLPTSRNERRDIGLVLKRALFPGAAYRHAKKRGEQAMAQA